MAGEGGIPGSETQPLTEGPPPSQDGARGGVGNEGLGGGAGLLQGPRTQEETPMDEADRTEEDQRMDIGPLGLLFDTFGGPEDEEVLEERIKDMESRTGARRKE